MLIRSEAAHEPSARRCRAELNLDTAPFTPGDVTAGTEDELQAVVIGSSDSCDLPISIRDSRFFRNIARRISSGEATRQQFVELTHFLDDSEKVWENSWIRFPEHRLSGNALAVLYGDLGHDPWRRSRLRTDANRYVFDHAGERWIRVPISYALKLSLADVVGVQPLMPERLRQEAERLMGHFFNDNTSPETTSFHVVKAPANVSSGEDVARESARRFLFASLLMSWANRRFGLPETGQRAMVYHAPHPPVRQTELSTCLSDAFYRELFMSPCLSGWDDGEGKSAYMHLCHQVLSRSQLSSVGKLRDAGVIANNLIVLPSLSNVSLANNGIHISMGSRALGRALGKLEATEAMGSEKSIGDLAIKIFEHFLALFVGTYSGAPYRIDFAQFHPERLLAFLPHELDFTHLRLMWREWREKAKIRVFGRPRTPYGPFWIDRLFGKLFRLRGDLVPDYRLINYPVAWLATEQSSALDGTPGNTGRLAAELDQLGIVDRRMSFYMPVRLREYAGAGFSGFEARYYSLFPTYARDMAPAADLQQLLLSIAYELALSGSFTHDQIPDDPTAESERRQPFFFAAAGLPAFYVHKNSRNEFLRAILRHCTRTRASWRHPDYLRVSIRDYRRALLAYLRENSQASIDTFDAKVLLQDLYTRLCDPSLQASHRLTQDAMAGCGEKDAMRLDGDRFNRSAERYYRDELRLSQVAEALRYLREDSVTLQQDDDETRSMVRCGVRVQDPIRFLDSVSERALRDDLTQAEIATLINLMLVLTERDNRLSSEAS